MEPTETENLILQIIEKEGGAIPSAFFSKTCREMVDKGLLKAVFEKEGLFASKYEYQIAKKEAAPCPKCSKPLFEHPNYPGLKGCFCGYVKRTDKVKA